MPTVTLTQGSTAPILTDIIQVNGAVVDLTGATVKFRMRHENSTTLKVDSSATVVSASAGSVSYAWTTSNTDTQGTYFGWWHIVHSSGKIQQTPEFKITIDAIGPGTAETTGQIATQVRHLMPVTWDALSKDPRYGDDALQTRINYVKYKLYATVCTPAAEGSLYNPLQLDYLVKETALQVIPAGIDYWMEQHITSSTNGTSEAVSYPDRIRHLERLQEWLFREVAELRQELPGEFVVRKRGRGPAVSNTSEGNVTPDPQEFGEPTDEGLPTNLPWGPFG